jgi:ParB/RepB/Spo0J family partition protein
MSTMSTKKKTTKKAAAAQVAADDLPVQWAAVADLAPHPQNPRELVTEGPEWEAFLASIAEHGVLQPLLVRPAPGGSGDQVVGGHRRLAAAMAAGHDRVPVMRKDLSDREALEILLIENLERSDLNAMEEAAGVCALVTDGHASREEVATMLHRSEDWVQLRLDLPLLPEDAQTAVRTGQLSLGVAREVLAVPIDERERAIQLVLYPDFEAEPLSLRKARLVLEEEVWHWRRLSEAWAAMTGEARRQFPGADPIADPRQIDDLIYFHGALRYPQVSLDAGLQYVLPTESEAVSVVRPASVWAEHVGLRGTSYPVTDDEGSIVRIGAAISAHAIAERMSAAISAMADAPGSAPPEWMATLVREELESRGRQTEGGQSGEFFDAGEDEDDEGITPGNVGARAPQPLDVQWQQALEDGGAAVFDALQMYDLEDEQREAARAVLVRQRGGWLAWLREGRERMADWLPEHEAATFDAVLSRLQEIAAQLDSEG